MLLSSPMRRKAFGSNGAPAIALPAAAAAVAAGR